MCYNAKKMEDIAALPYFPIRIKGRVSPLVSPIAALRYLLIFIPSVATLYLSDVGSYREYTAMVLLFLLAGRLREFNSIRRSDALLFSAEALFAGYLHFRFGGCLYFLFGSTLASRFGTLRQSRYRLPTAAVPLAVMNLTFTQPSFETVFLSNFVYLLLYALLVYTESLTARQSRAEELYHRLSGKHLQLNESQKRLLDHAQRVENAAQIEERNRISREIHDDLGHKLIRLKMMMEAAVRLLSAPAQFAKGVELAEQVRDQLSDTMESLRATVRRMKPEDSDVRQYSLSRLVEDFGGACGIRVNFETTGTWYDLPPSVEVLLYRNAQEAMTNAVRHGQADEVWVRLHLEPKRIVFTVSNNGIIPETIGQKGLGLTGMEERVEMLGGQLFYELSGRFSVTTVLPHRSDDMNHYPDRAAEPQGEGRSTDPAMELQRERRNVDSALELQREGRNTSPAAQPQGDGRNIRGGTAL